MSFKICTTCRHIWRERSDFLSDPDVLLVGYQANFGDLEEGLFLFMHTAAACGTSLALEAGLFKDLHEGPIFATRMTATEKCPGFCLHKKSLAPCDNACECAFVRNILQRVKTWPKLNPMPAV